MIHALSCALFGHSIPLPDFPSLPGITGIGMSDWDGYAVPLATKLDYRNTYYHRNPRLDITDISIGDVASVDFILSTDVFEHVRPPVSIAFENAGKMLKPGGALIFSVPYASSGETVEHFPGLHDFRIETRQGRTVLLNTTADGIAQEFSDLVFHGGPGETLEMRVFSKSGLLREFAAAGFCDVRIMKDPCFEFGIWHATNDSLPIIARMEEPTLVVRDFGPRVMSRGAGANPDGATNFWIAHDSPACCCSHEVEIGGVLVAGLVHGLGVTTGLIPESIMSRNGPYPIVVRDRGQAIPAGMLYVVD